MATIDRGIEISQGTSDELDLVMTVMETAFGEGFGEAWTRSQLAGILPMTGVSLIIARASQDEIAGFTLSRTVAEESELLLIAVKPDRHRRGIGRMLIDDFIERSRGQGVERVHLEVRDGNPAIVLYEVAGFSPVGRRRNYYHGRDGARFDAITLARTI